MIDKELRIPQNLFKRFKLCFQWMMKSLLVCVKFDVEWVEKLQDLLNKTDKREKTQEIFFLRSLLK